MNINQKIQEFLTEHQYQKKRRIFTAVLSLMIVFSVVSSLIMPAISMTMQDLDDAAAVETIDAEPAEENIMLLGDETEQTEPINLAERATSISISAFDLGENGNEKHNIDNDYVVSTDKTKVAFEVSYTLNNMKDVFKKDADFDNLYIDINNFIIKDIGNGNIYDGNYEDGEAGSYTFEGGKIHIKLTNAYIDYINKGTGNVTGTLNFSGELSRNNTASGDQTITIGGQDIVIPFQDKQAGVEKNYWVDSSKGEIEWTITVKPNGLSLKDYTLVDNMLEKASGNISITPANAATYDSSNKKVTFDESNTGNVTIKYRTKIETADLQAGSMTNKATLQKDEENPIEDSKTVTFDKIPINVDKDGKADYENGKSRSNKIDWTITITNEYNTSLNGYQIKDANLPESGVTISPDTCSLEKVNGVWILKNADNVTKVTLNYSADAEEGDNTNSVSINYPDGKPTGGETEKTVHYKKESEMISVNKSGSYNQDTHKITWTIQVTPENGYSLKDYYLEDSQFPSSTDQITVSGCEKSDFTINNGRLTFNKDITSSVTLQYETTVSVPENNSNAEVTTAVTNEIGDKFSTTTVVSVSVKSRNTITKTVVGNSNMSVSQSDEISQELSWRVDITRDGSFENYIYMDTLTAPTNATHTITDAQLDALKVLAKTQEYGNATELKKDTDYKIVKDANGFHIEFLSTTKDYNYISLEYSTTATISADADYGQYTFNNKGSSNKGGGEPNPGVTIEKKNPVQTIQMSISKDWENDTADVRPTSITFKVQYQENNGDWKDLKKSGDTYLFEGDSDYASASVVEVTLTATNKVDWTDSRWMTTISGLPSSITKDGQTKTYQYRTQEIKYNGDTEIQGGIITVDSGFYRDSSKNGGYSGKVDGNGDALVTNHFYPNISLKPVKTWKDGNNNNADLSNYDGVKEITVVLVSQSKDTQGKFCPVKDSSGNVLTATLTKDNGWGKDLTAWSGLSSNENYLLIETSMAMANGDVKNLFTVSGDGDSYDNKEISFAVGGTYYKASIGSSLGLESGTSDISATNTVYETKSLKIGVTKIWSPSKPDGVSGVVVELQRKASNSNTWTAYPENDTTKSRITLNSDNSWQADWNGIDLPNQNVDNTARISYTYRVVEVGYVKSDGTTIAIKNNAFALATSGTDTADGLYKATYQNQELTKDGIVAITNTYESLKSIELTPEKKWTGDNETVRPTSITLQLQRKAGTNGEWQDVEGKTITLTSSDLPNQWDKSTWKSDSKKFTNLPAKEIKVNADGSYTETTYSYRLIETEYTLNGTTTKIPSGDVSFKVSVGDVDGTYSYSSDVNNGNSGTLTITNSFKESVGITKYSWGNGTTPVDSIDASNIASLSNYLKNINGEQYYVFNWEIEYDTNDANKVPLVADKLPDGFTLCVDISSDYFNPGNTETNIGSWGSGTVSTPLDPKANRGGDGYYTNPCIIWKKAGGVNYIAPVNSKEDAWKDPGKNSSRYYYDAENNVIYFGLPSISEPPAFLYSIKIKKADLEAKIAQGNVKIENHADVYDLNGNPTGKDDNASLIIKNQTPTDLITKTYQSAALPGYISYTLDINPQGKTLSSGDTIDIEDLFKTVSYYDSDWNGEKTTNGENLVDVLMRNINIYKIDANGDKQQLSANDYTLQFDCSENGVKNSDNESGAALLKLTVPDATHLQVTYSYKIIANKNTPSVIHGCLVRKNGRYVPMESGLVPPAGDKITFSNTAKLKADSASGESSHNNQEYTVFQSGGTISTNPIPKVYKINTGDYTIKSLNASFLLAKYESGNWYYASNVNADGDITWGNQSFSGKTVPATDAYVIEVEETQPKISLEQNVLYKLVEISVPAGYEGSNLNLPSGTDFRALVTGYLNSNLTKYGEQDYATFLKNYDPNHYFSFNSNVSSIPNDVSQSEIQQIKSGDDLNISNNELIDIGVNKQWVNSTNTIPENASITVELYWSYEKSTSGIPASATLAKAEDLGILDISFTATKTLKGETNAKVWTDLPNGKAGKPIYYYVKETAYAYDGNTYTLQEDGNYKSGSDLGGYLPIYQNNAANRDATVQIQNTQRLMLKKVWKNINNQDMKPLVSEVSVIVYGIKVDSAGNETKEALFENSVTLGDTNSWQLDITNLIVDKKLSDYKRFEVTETGVDTSNMVISCVFNLNQNTGEIIVTNKSTQPTDASVTVQKAWSDGETLHESESVQVSLYQSTKALPSGTTLDADWIMANATKMTDAKYTVQLNKDNEWTYTWTGLPLEDENKQTYYYYVLEDLQSSDVKNSDKYTATYTKSSNSTAYKTNYTITNSRSAITVQKQWYDEDGNLITNLYDEDGNLVTDNMANLQAITLKVYKKTGTVPTDSIGIVAFGDSITDGYGECSRNDKCYPSQLTTMLTAAGFTLNNSAVDNQGVSQQQIGDAGQGFRSRVGNIPTDTKIVCLLGGTNDIHQGGSSVKGDPDGVFNRLQGLISDIKMQAPDATIFVGSIPHFDFYKNETLTEGGSWWNWLSGYADNDGAKPNGLIDQYNAKIKAYAEETDGVYFVDVCSVVTDDDIRADGCHPNEAGYTKIATAYSNAIQSYYTSKEPVQENGQDLTITLDHTNNWRAAIDVPAGDNTYCVEEVDVPDGWNVTYENNAQQANSTTPILVKNQKQPTNISLTVEKTWAKDDASKRPDSISLTLLRSNGKKQDNSDAANESEWFWEELEITTPTPTKNGDKWTFAYTGLPAKDVYGNDYHYKVQEAAVSGYTVSYGAGEESGVTAEAGDSATLHVTNTRAIALQIEKQWSDGADNHTMDKVQVRIYRSTDQTKVPNANLTLQVTPEVVSVGINGTATVTANKDITIKDNSNSNIVEASVTGKTLTIIGKTVGTTTITVTDGTMEKQISVTVSVEPTLNLSISPASIQVEETATLTPSMSDGSECNGVTYTITAGDDVVSISGDTVTGLKAGTATIVAKLGNKTSNEVTITVTEPPLSLEDNVTVSVGDTTTIHANRTVTISQDPVDSIATVSVSGKDITVTGVAEGSTSFTVKDSDGNEKMVSVTVEKSVEFKLYKDGVDVTNKGLSNEDRFKVKNGTVVTFKTSIPFTSVKTTNDYFISVNKINEKEFIVGVGSGNIISNYGNGFDITYNDASGTSITKKYYVEITDADPPITLTASSKFVKTEKTLQIKSDVEGVTYSSSNAQIATVDATTGLVTGVSVGEVTITAKKNGYTDGTINLTVTDVDITGKVLTSNEVYTFNIPEKYQDNIKKLEVSFVDYSATNNGGINVYFNASNAIDTQPNSWIEFDGSDGNMKNLYIFNDYNNYFSKVSGQFGTVNGNTAIWEKNSASKNEKIIFQAKDTVNCTITKISIINEAGETHTITNFEETYSSQSLTTPRKSIAAAAVIESEQLLSDSNETAGVQTQALENTIDASQVSDSDWESGLLLEIDATDNWQGTVTNLPVTDSNGHTYYYWAVEEPVTGYTPSYLFQDSDNSQDTAIKADAQVDGTDIIILNTKQDTSYTLPSTGGTGVTRYYLIGLLLVGGSGLVICYQFRRKRHENCIK